MDKTMSAFYFYFLTREECDLKFSTYTNYYYRVNERFVVVIVRFTLYYISIPAILLYY